MLMMLIGDQINLTLSHSLSLCASKLATLPSWRIASDAFLTETGSSDKDGKLSVVTAAEAQKLQNRDEQLKHYGFLYFDSQ